MRKFVKIVGVGERRSGISKNTNKPYDFTPVAFTYEMPGFTGVKCATANLSADCMADYYPIVDDVVEVVMREDFRTGAVYIDAVL